MATQRGPVLGSYPPGLLRERLQADPAVRRLIQALALADDFQLNIVSCPSALLAHELIDLAIEKVAQLREEPVTGRCLPTLDTAGDPDATALAQQILIPLIEHKNAAAGVAQAAGAGQAIADSAANAGEATPDEGAVLVFIDALRGSARNTEPWVELFQRMNQARNVIAQQLRAPLTLLLPDWLERALTAAAPDLWSVRGAVLTLQPVALPHLSQHPILAQPKAKAPHTNASAQAPKPPPPEQASAPSPPEQASAPSRLTPAPVPPAQPSPTAALESLSTPAPPAQASTTDSPLSPPGRASVSRPRPTAKTPRREITAEEKTRPVPGARPMVTRSGPTPLELEPEPISSVQGPPTQQIKVALPSPLGPASADSSIADEHYDEEAHHYGEDDASHYIDHNEAEQDEPISSTLNSPARETQRKQARRLAEKVPRADALHSHLHEQGANSQFTNTTSRPRTRSPQGSVERPGEAMVSRTRSVGAPLAKRADSALYRRAKPEPMHKKRIPGRTLQPDAHQALSDALNMLDRFFAPSNSNQLDSVEYGELLEQVLKLAEDLSSQESSRSDHRRTLHMALVKLADLRLAEGNIQQAKTLYERSLDESEWLIAHEPAQRQHRRDLGATLNQLAAIHRAEGSERHAQPMYERSLALRDLTDPQNAPLTTDSNELSDRET